MAEDGGWEEVPRRRRRQRNGDYPPPPQTTTKPDSGPTPPTPSAPVTPPSAQRVAALGREPFLLLLVGLQGSGKSTFASRLAESAPWRYVRVSQDALGGDRIRCEYLTRSTLAEGRVPVVDRCNVDRSQRRPFLDIAVEAGVSSECVIFRADAEDCVRRCVGRKDRHETLRPHEARGAVERMAERFDPPLPPVPGRKSRKGESFRGVENVSTFEMANEVANEYIARAL